MPSRFVEVTGTLDELDLRTTLRRWPQVNVSGMLESIPHMPEPVQKALDRAPPKMVSCLYAASILLLLMRVCMVGCWRRSILKSYAHAKRL